MNIYDFYAALAKHCTYDKGGCDECGACKFCWSAPLGMSVGAIRRAVELTDCQEAEMEIREFYDKLAKQCICCEGHCVKCGVRMFCYTAPINMMTAELVRKAKEFLEGGAPIPWTKGKVNEEENNK